MFQPRYSNGDKVKLMWQLFLYKLCVCWPVAEDINKILLWLRRIYLIILSTSFICTLSAEFTFIVVHRDDIVLVTECCCTTLTGLTLFTRILVYNARTDSRKVNGNFYSKIFLMRGENDYFENKLKKYLKPAFLLSYSYIVPVSLFMFIPILILIINPSSKPMLYRMIFPYDEQQPLAYGITLAYTWLIGTSCCCLIIADDMNLCLMLCHTAIRYEMLHTELQSLYTNAAEKAKNIIADHLSLEQRTLKYFKDGLKDIQKKHQELDNFVYDIDHHFSTTIFIVVSTNTFLLCVIAFQLARFGFNARAIEYLTWMASVITQLFVLGFNGQRLTTLSEDLGNLYWMTGWENLLPAGTLKENKALLGDLSFAIFRTQKPLELTGLHFLNLSLVTITRTLSTSMSYFMFLTTMKERA